MVTENNKINKKNKRFDDKKKCVYCKQLIEHTAIVCHICGRSQNKLWNLVNNGAHITTIIMVFIAIIQLVIAYQQMQEAKNERIAASEALERAKQAEKKFEEKFGLLSQELYILQVRNRITALGDSAIAVGNRKAFNKLMSMANDTMNNDLKFLAQSERLRVYSFHGAIQFYGDLIDTLSNGEVKKEKDFTLPELINILKNHKDWKRRAASARLLGSKNFKGVPEALFYCIKNDQNLFVIRWAIDSFESITGCSTEDTFGFDDLYKCWEERSEKIKNKMKDYK